ncbi:glutathione S-transferase N-terminal domain-containing protein [Pseudooceanicola sp. MF1-13]|uniref:glutathione S-transferase N-terminal domain-containing protein n=1 Tax=Pseudooceanicola sp. MF1-13 TaxID=3379095 RepID=UPI003891A28F
MFPDDFPIAQRWPATNPDVIQLYSFPTPNGVKASIMLEETGLEYEPHLVTLADKDVKSPEFLSLNPNNKIPAIIDPNGPDGPLGLFESGAILIYLAEKSGKFIGSSASDRAGIIQWLMFQMGGVGPMFGQLGFFYKFAGSEIEDPRPQERYINEAKRLLAVLEDRMADRDWIADEYSIADIALCPWVNALEFYGAKEVVGWDDLKHVPAWIDRFMDRPAVQRGAKIPDPNG